MFLRRSVVMVVILLMLARSWMTPCCGLVSPRPQLASDWSVLASPGLSLVEDGREEQVTWDTLILGNLGPSGVDISMTHPNTETFSRIESIDFI